MISRRQTRRRSKELACYLEGELSASDAARLEQHLDSSPEARGQLQQLHNIRDGLAATDPELENVDLVGPLMVAIAAEHTPKPTRSPWFIWGACAAAMSAVAFASAFGLRGGSTSSAPEYREKSATGSPDDRTLAGVHVYRALDGEAPEPIDGKLSHQDGLLFSFLNTGYAPFEYLMVFGVDAANEVRWFFPAHLEEGTSPMSIPITEQRSQSLLPDVIQHDFASGHLAIYALFLHRPLHVQEVESWLLAERFRPANPPQPGAKLQKLEFTVTP